MNNSEAKQTILEADSCFCKHGAYKDCHSGCKYREALDAAVKALEQEPTIKNDLVAIHTEGLDEGIRCAMCTNSMANDLGCDGECVVNKSMYEKVMDVIENHIAELPSVTPQEPFKPIVEIDLYSVIKQKYIERDVLDKISAEIERQEKWLMVAGYSQYNVDIALDAIKSVVDKYKAESEPQESENT